MAGEINLADFERSCAAAVEGTAWDYYRSGADDEVCLARNRSSFAEVELYYRTLVDVSTIHTGATLLGQSLSMPVVLAPTAFHRLAHPDGELATARACKNAGLLMTLSTLSTTAIEEVVPEAAGRVWFQLYVYRDREKTRELVQRAEAAGATALVLTVDAPVLGMRERDARNCFRLPQGLRIENMLGLSQSSLDENVGASGLTNYFASLLDPSLSWSDLEWLRGITKLPLLIKGIVRADDAQRAVEHGADGVWVSNHGGRQLDASPATIRALPDIAQAVGGRTEIIVDGGFRRGTDIVKAIALGANAVALGRPTLWGLGAGGEAGLTRLLGILRNELERAMALSGAPRLSDINDSLLGTRSKLLGTRSKQ